MAEPVVALHTVTKENFYQMFTTAATRNTTETLEKKKVVLRCDPRGTQY